MTREQLLQKATAAARDMLNDCTSLSDGEFDDIVRRGQSDEVACHLLAAAWLQEAADELGDYAAKAARKESDGQGT